MFAVIQTKWENNLNCSKNKNFMVEIIYNVYNILTTTIYCVIMQLHKGKLKEIAE
jgi:hypothetical protein